MQTILGFLFDFKSNAGKTFKKVRGEIVKSTKAWGKAITDFSKKLKNMAKISKISFTAMIGDMRHYAAQLKKTAPSIEEIISSIADNFGGVAGIIADTLMRPGALMAAGLATATNVAIGFKDTITETGKETGMSAEQLVKYGDSLKKIAADMRAPTNQITSLGKRFASANISVEEFNDLMITAVSMNRVSGQETSMFAKEILAMRGQLKMGSRDIQNFYNTLYAAVQATGGDMDTLVGVTDMMIDLVGRTLPAGLRQAGMESGIMLAGGLSQALGDEAPGVISKLYTVMMDKSNPDRAKFLTSVSFLGDEAVRSFTEAIEKGDFLSAFEVFQKSMNSLDPGSFMQIQSAMEDTFGFSMDVLQKIKGIDASFYSAARNASNMSKSTNKIAVDGKTMMTTAQRWHKIWSDIERILLPIGEVLVDMLNGIMSFFEPITKLASQFMSSLSNTGKVVVTILVGAGLVKVAFSSIVAVATQLWASLVQSTATILGMPLAIGRATTAMGAFVATSTGANSALGSMFGGIASGIGAMTKGLLGFIKFAWVAALPFIKIIAILWVIDAVIKEVTEGQYGLMDLVTGALKVIGWVINQIAKTIGFIVAAVKSLFTWDSKYLREWGLNANKNYSEEYDKKNSPTQVGNYTPQDMPAVAPKNDTLASGSSGTFSSGEGTRNARKDFGTDDMISAQYEAAEMIVKAIIAAATPRSALAPGPVGNPSRHKSIPEPTNIGSPR